MNKKEFSELFNKEAIKICKSEKDTRLKKYLNRDDFLMLIATNSEDFGFTVYDLSEGESSYWFELRVIFRGYEVVADCDLSVSDKLYTLDVAWEEIEMWTKRCKRVIKELKKIND